ncbi:MAG: hypothetical protein IT450_07865 [Phycisphaerales bacterium]|nr:hypothetical protein [Phycisphaerales bacterium]
MMKRGNRLLTAVAFFLAATMVLGQDTQPSETGAATPPAAATEPVDPTAAPPTIAPDASRVGDSVANTLAGDSSSERLAREPVWKLVAPSFSQTDVSWIAAAIVLTLLVQLRPIFSTRNLDALVLALMCLNFPLRALGAASVEGDPSGRSVQFYGYLALSVFTAYWLARGVGLVCAKRVVPFTVNAAPAGLAVLVVASLALGMNALFTQPVSEASRYAMVGGMYFRDTGKLPYGELLGRDDASPLNYLLHAGATKLIPPINEDVALGWSNRSEWLTAERIGEIDTAAARLVNGVLFILLFGGVAWLGHRLHSFSMGKTAAAILCVMPMTHACLGEPAIMIPAVLLTWALAFAAVPGVGLTLAAFLVVVAGLAWPWAWLVLLPLLAYSTRRGWQAFGAVLGTLGGAAACLAILYVFAAPALPRPDRAIAAIGERPQYGATISGGRLMVEKWPDASPPPAANAAKTWFWNLLLDADTSTMVATDHSLTLPVGVDPAAVRYRDVAPSTAALALVQPGYRDAVAGLPDGQRLLIAIRTVLEAVWLGPESRSASVPPVWDVWFRSGSPTERSETITLVRRIGKGVVGLLALLLAIVVLRRENATEQAVLGAVLAITAGVALCSFAGAVSDAVWWIPALLGAIAAGGEPLPLFSRPGVRGGAEHERITVE